MYSQRASSRQDFKPLETRALIDAVHLISSNLVKRAAISGSPEYANLLRQIWGQSEYATIEVLAAKRKQAELKRSRPVDRSKSHEPPKRRLIEQKEKLDAARDVLVRILRHKTTPDELATNEYALTEQLIANNAPNLPEALSRLWAVPKVIFEVTAFTSFISAANNFKLIENFYLKHIFNQSPDARTFNMLYWSENNVPVQRQIHAYKDDVALRRSKCRSVSRQILGSVIEQLLTKRQAAFYGKIMPIAIETVLYAMHPDRFVERYTESSLRDAGFATAIRTYEYSRSFTASLENLQLGKLNRLLKDIRAVRGLAVGGNDQQTSASLLRVDAVRKYCTVRETLTDRALSAVLKRYVTTGRSGESVQAMREEDFTRMYLALVGSGSDHGLKYWFSVLDQDGDGRIGVGDICHFYSERRAESEKRNGIILADSESLWIRLCAMCGVCTKTGGIGLNSLKELGREDREFIMCSLLIRRVDDGNLINVAATVTAGAGDVSNL